MRFKSQKHRNLGGKLLVASPYIADDYFARTVVLLLQHTRKGSTGLILNRPIGLAGKSLWQHIHSEGVVGAESDRPIYLGGPQSGPVVAVHQVAELGEFAVAQNLFLAADRTHLGQLLERDSGRWRVFVGHAAWSRGDLEREIDQGAWMVLPASAERVFADQTEIWTQAVRAVGRQVLESHIDSRRIPPDPRLN